MLVTLMETAGALVGGYIAYWSALRARLLYRKSHTLTGAKLMELEHGAGITHLEEEGCLVCHPPAPVPRVSVGMAAYNPYEPTPAYREAGSDLAISIAPQGLVSPNPWVRAVDTFEHLSGYLTPEDIERLTVQDYLTHRGMLLHRLLDKGNA